MSTDIDLLLRSEDFDVPGRSLSANFSARIISELQEEPIHRSRMSRIKELTMHKKISFATIAIMIVSIIGIGTITYAVIHHFSLNEIMNIPIRHDSSGNVIRKSSGDMQQLVLTYINEKKQNKPDAYMNFTSHVSAELLTKMNATQGIDPIVCAQSMPASVRFEQASRDVPMTVVEYFGDNSELRVQIAYDDLSGLFTDIRCPANPKADASQRMQGFYTQYINELALQSPLARDNFYQHVTPALKSELEKTTEVDLVTCSQNVPASISYSNVTNTDITAHVRMMGGEVIVKLTYDPSTLKFTRIDCPPTPQI